MELDEVYRASSYILDYDAIDDARFELGVIRPAEFLIRAMYYRDGTYLGIHEAKHRISIAADLTPHGVSKLIWHELTHAKQCEEWGGVDRFNDEYDRQLEEVGLNPSCVQASRLPNLYKKIPFEAEAYKNGRKNAHILLAQHRPEPKSRKKLLPTGAQLVEATQYLLNV